jgi:hypothetical protein
MRTLKALFLTLLAGTPAVSVAQSTPLSQIIYSLYTKEIQDNLRAYGGDPATANRVLAYPLALTEAVSNELSTFPLGSSAGGFSWTFNPSVGTVTRNSRSFGPIFAERGLTAGQKSLNIGVNFLRTTYDEFENKSLEGGEITFYTPILKNLIGDDALLLTLSTTTAAFLANYGITDRWDVGFALPITTIDVKAALHFIIRDSTGARHPQYGGVETTRSDAGSHSGVGDIILRTKYRAVALPGGGVAAGIDARLPTGDDDNLLGIPGAQVKFYGITSWAVGSISPHVNLGYTFSTGNENAPAVNPLFLKPPNEVNYALGTDVAVSDRLTMAGDVLGRLLLDVPRLAIGEVGLGPHFQQFIPQGTENKTLVLAAVGVKFNAWSNLLISLSGLVPLTKAGLADNFTPIAGLDYSF